MSDQTRSSSMLITTPSASAGRARAKCCISTNGARRPGSRCAVPGGTGGVVPFVTLERAGVVHQHADGAERFAGARPAACRFADSSARSAAQHDGAAAALADLGGGRLGGGGAGVAMQRDVEAGTSQGERDGTADTLGGAGDQRGARDVQGYRQHRVAW